MLICLAEASYIHACASMRFRDRCIVPIDVPCVLHLYVHVWVRHTYIHAIVNIQLHIGLQFYVLCKCKWLPYLLYTPAKCRTIICSIYNRKGTIKIECKLFTLIRFCPYFQLDMERSIFVSNFYYIPEGLFPSQSATYDK